MAPEPVTLKVQIYSATFNVTYPSDQRVTDLIEEFATMCKGDRKPCGKRRFFVCIYCGADWFSNKMMLNRHRFIDGCKNAKYPDGRMALLLPYPDLKTGEGKKVEVLSKKNGAAKTKRTTPVSNSAVGEGGADGLVGEDAEEGGIGSKVEVRVPAFTQVPADLLWKEVPPEVVAWGNRPMTGNGNKRKTTPKKVVQRGSSPKPTGSKPINKGRPSPKRDVAVHIRALKDLQMRRSMEESQEKQVSGEGPRRIKRKASEAIACGNVTDDDDDLDLPDVVEEVREASTSGLKVAVQGSGELNNAFHFSMREPQLERPSKHMKVNDGPSQDVSFCKSNLQMIKEKAISTLQDRFQLKVPSIAGRTSLQSCLPKIVRCDDRIQHVPVKYGIHDNAVLWAPCNYGAPDVQCHSVEDLEDGHNLQPCKVNQTESMSPESLDERVSAMVIWSGNWMVSNDLRNYWSEGLGCPRPFTFHPELLLKAEQRLETFSRLEKIHVQRHCKAAADLEEEGNALPKPEKPPMPALYRLRDFEGEVSVPWSWNCDSGEQFVTKWNEVVNTDAFKDRLMRVAYWWIRRKVCFT